MEEEKKDFLECERMWVFAVLICAGGYLGAFTYSIRGGVFCNAQSANFVLFSMAVGNLNFKKALYYFIPMSAYLLGAIISEICATTNRKHKVFRWETICVGLEMIVIIILGFLPETVPYQISQVTINFICSMQYNTFRQAQNIPMATVFCTNHLRQTGIHIVKWMKRKEDSASMRRALSHVGMLFMFVVGGIISTVLCKYFLGKAIWGAAILMLVVFVDLMKADLKKEKLILDEVLEEH